MTERSRRRHCPHLSPRGIYGDEVNRTKFRLQCMDCGSYLDGPVVLAKLRRNELATLTLHKMGILDD